MFIYTCCVFCQKSSLSKFVTMENNLLIKLKRVKIKIYNLQTKLIFIYLLVGKF